MKDFRERLGREWLFWDGGMGTLLQARGLAGGELPETWNLRYPERIREIHEAYMRAGCNIINTNTFGANRLKYPEELAEIVSAGVRIAREARDNVYQDRTAEQDIYIALDIGPTGKLLSPLGDLPFEEAVSIFAEVVRAGAEAGADLVLIETMNDSYEAKAAVLAARENCSLPVVVTTVYDEKGKLLTGGTPESVTATLEGLRVDALGVNCSLGPRQMLPIVQRLAAATSIPVVVNPNAGLPREEGGRTVYDMDAREWAETMTEIAACGVQVLGGCCGTTPEYLSELIGRVRAAEGGIPFRPQTRKDRTVVSSFSQAVEIGGRPVIIGERINPTGKKRFKQALRERDIDYILAEGLRQEDAGAHVLDVNVGLPEIDEPAMMEQVVRELQSVTAMPLQIDTSDPAAMERGLRYCSGKPLLNSVNGKQEVLETVLPIAARYGAVVVGLCLDEGGIPDTADGRVAIARRIYETAERYGIERRDVVIDGLAMTISSDTRSAQVTLETLRRVRDELGGHTILGVSNISFGLPQRELINAAFLTMAMQNGLSCAIMNPCSEEMMRAYRSYCALADLDPQCREYIAAYANAPKAVYGQAPAGSSAGAAGTAGTQSGGAASGAQSQGAASGARSLGECIERGLIGPAREAAAAGLRTMPGLELIEKELIPALDRVGRGFEEGTLFLPQLLMSADAARAAFDAVRESMADQPRESRGTVILATVKGDIHDIGKNIVKVMLENYGYEVIDLGKDVAPEVIVETALEKDVRLVGLSALMTTTVVSMEETIRQLRERKPDTKVVVGGAVLTQEYADAIGADCYARDAMATVRYADSVFGY